MPLPIVPIGIVWIFAAAAAFGGLTGVIVFLTTKESSLMIMTGGAVFIVILLIPYLSEKLPFVRYVKRKVRHQFREESSNDQKEG